MDWLIELMHSLRGNPEGAGLIRLVIVLAVVIFLCIFLGGKGLQLLGEALVEVMKQ